MKERFNVDGMTCAACQAHVEKAAKGVKGVVSCNVNLLNNNMDVELSSDYIEGSLESAVDKAGYKAYKGGDKTQAKALAKSKDHALRDLIIGFVILLLLMYVSMGNMMWGWPLPDVFDMNHNKMGFALIQFILILPILYIYRRYFISGFTKLFRGAPNMDTLIAVGSTASMIYGIISLFMISYGYYSNNFDMINEYHMNLYFESAGMILVLVSFGKYLEGLSKKKTTKALEELMDLAPKKANVLRDGNEVTIEASELKVSDIILIRRGEQIPCDAKVLDGDGSVNEANITGESIPRYKEKGDFLYASTVLESGFIKAEATKVGDDSSINTIIKLVSEAANSKAPISKLADKVSAVFVPIILTLATITFIVNMIVGNILDLDTNVLSLSLNFAITVVVIACPCALGLATPVAIMVGTGKAAKEGLIIKNAEILENTSKIKTIVFDKTGTITVGKPNVTDYEEYIPNLKSILYAIENSSSHPLAKAIIEYTKDSMDSNINCDNEEVIEGRGLIANINNNEYYVGNYKYLEDNNLENNELKSKIDKLSNEGKTVLVILENKKLAGLISLKDMPKENSKEAIAKLNALGIKTVMLTGDNSYTSSVIAKEVGISEVISEVLSVDKGNVLNDLKKKENGLVAMVGDGVNDAIALANADIAISVGNGSDIAIDASDIVLIHNDLNDISNVIRLSRRVLNTIKLCLFWAFFYNFICVLLATGFLYYINGFKLTPIYGSIAMSISSVSVVLTALTINFFKTSNKKEEVKVINENEKTFKVKGMMCDKCIKHVEDACLKVDGVKTAHASLKTNTVTVEFDGSLNSSEIIKNITSAGYKAKEAK